jgi:zinc and cadmium transporter
LRGRPASIPGIRGSTILQTALYSTVAGCALFAGVLLIQLRERWARSKVLYLVGFAAGTMLAIAFLHILPEAIHLTEGSETVHQWTLPACFLAFLGFYLLEQFVIMHPCEGDDCESHRPAGSLGLIAILLHALLDGVLIGVGFEVSPELGVMTSLGILFHKLPVGVTAMSLFYVAGMTRGQAIFRATGLAIATPVGAIAAYLLLDDVSEPMMGIILAISAGSFLYIAASDLIPMTHQQRNRTAFLAVFAGAGLVFLAGMLAQGH